MSINQRPPHLLRWPVQHWPAKQQIIRQSSLEQTLRKFSSVEARSRIERNSLPTTPVLGVKITRTVTSRSVSAGVVEIRKAFERVKEELETESNCNYGQFGKRQFGKLQAAPLAIFAPAARLFVPLPAPTRPHVDSKTAACHLVTATVLGASVTVLITAVRSAALRHWSRPLRRTES